jgi:hypothetical protein
MDVSAKMEEQVRLDPETFLVFLCVENRPAASERNDSTTRSRVQIAHPPASPPSHTPRFINRPIPPFGVQSRSCLHSPATHRRDRQDLERPRSRRPQDRQRHGDLGKRRPLHRYLTRYSDSIGSCSSAGTRDRPCDLTTSQRESLIYESVRLPWDFARAVWDRCRVD